MPSTWARYRAGPALRQWSAGRAATSTARAPRAAGSKSRSRPAASGFSRRGPADASSRSGGTASFAPSTNRRATAAAHPGGKRQGPARRRGPRPHRRPLRARAPACRPRAGWARLGLRWAGLLVLSIAVLLATLGLGLPRFADEAARIVPTSGRRASGRASSSPCSGRSPDSTTPTRSHSAPLPGGSNRSMI